MERQDFKLLFETERRILERRLEKLFPGGRERHRVAEVAALDRRAVPLVAEPAPATRAGNGATPAPHPITRDAPRNRYEMQDFEPQTKFLSGVISIAAHILILVIVLPGLQLAPPESKEPESHRLQIRPRFLIRGAEETARPVPTLPAVKSERSQEIVKSEPPLEPVHVSEPSPTELVASAPEVAPSQAPALNSAAALSIADPGTVLGVGGGTSGSGHATGSASARKSGRADAIGAFGGGSDTEQAVIDGLAWLARHQDSDGGWSPDGFARHCTPGVRCGGPGNRDNATAVTALAVLAFLGSGVDGIGDHEYRAVVKTGLEFLLRRQDEQGRFGAVGKYMYNHAIATFCISEAYLLTQDPDYGAAAERALRFSADAQQPGGGWDYTAVQTLRNDLSITGWQIMALHVAKEAGIFYPPEMESRARQFVARAVQSNGWSVYADRGIGAGRQGVSIAAVGMLSKLYLDWSPRSPELERCAELIVAAPPNAELRPDWERHFQSAYYWYYATLSLFHMGGDVWEAWNILLKREVLPLQNKDGERKGSWDPDPNWIGAEGGRILSTALNVLSFEVYYRYRPLYKRFGIVPATGAGSKGSR